MVWKLKQYTYVSFIKDHDGILLCYKTKLTICVQSATSEPIRDPPCNMRPPLVDRLRLLTQYI
jgi:hypothetical protein